jgi:integrase
MASIRRKGPSFQVVWAVYEEDRRIQRTRNFATLATAKQYRATVELLERRGVGAARMTVGAYLDEWLADRARTVELNTLAGYARWIGHIKRCPLATLPLDRITPRDLEQAYHYLQDTPAAWDRPLSPQSVRHVHAVLQNALNDAKRHRLIDDNPALAAKPPRGQSPKVAVPSIEQLGAFLDSLTATNPEMADLAQVIVGTGLRRSEALGLRWQDIDWAGQRITIAQVVIEHAGKYSIRRGTKSIAGQRTIGVAADLLAVLRRQQDRVAELRLKIGRFWQDHDLVFPATEGGPRCPAVITQAFARAARRAGWPENSSPVHSLRHAAASHTLAAGVDLATLSKRLGHSSPAMTARVYLSSDAERDRQAGEVMGRIASKKPSNL